MYFADDSRWVLYEGYLLIFIVLKFVATAFTLSCPVPGGIFTPTFALGAVLGQLYVATLRRVLLFVGVTDYIQCKYHCLSLFKLTQSILQTGESTPSSAPPP